MCGVAGWFSEAPLLAEQARPVLERMLESISHRGPDGRGLEILPQMAMGHLRLSIIDLDGGAQPLKSPDGRCLISYNGEIYNYRELRDSLAASGYPFRTASDTEVILALYQKEGVSGFSRMRGMFAFALWDSDASAGYLVRDLCGIKPLFYAADSSGRVVFASEAKAIIASGYVKPELDEPQLHQVMNFRYMLGNGSMFKGVSQLAPGDVLKWTPGAGLKKICSLSPAPPGDQSILHTLEESVESHLVSDVEVGLHLSGGVDSAAILAIAAKDHELRTFTMAIGDDRMEAANAADTAKHFGAENLCESVDYDVPALLPGVIWHMEMPKVNALQVYMLAGLSAQHVKVVLSGTGGDELFYGYNVYKILWQYQAVHRCTGLLRKSTGFDGFARSLFAGRYEWNEYDRMRAMLQFGREWPFIYGLIRNVWDCPTHRSWIYGPRMLDSQPHNAFSILSGLWPEGADPVEAARNFEWRNKLVNDLLWQEDRCSMAHSVESRVPLVDGVLGERVAQAARTELMPRGRLKHRMRQELSALLPDKVLNRKKSGFQVDSPAFFRQHLGAMVDEHLSPATVRRHGLFNPDFVSFLLQLPAQRRYRWHYFMLYLMIGSHIWLDLFEGNAAPLAHSGAARR